MISTQQYINTHELQKIKILKSLVTRRRLVHMKTEKDPTFEMCSVLNIRRCTTCRNVVCVCVCGARARVRVRVCVRARACVVCVTERERKRKGGKPDKENMLSIWNKVWNDVRKILVQWQSITQPIIAILRNTRSLWVPRIWTGRQRNSGSDSQREQVNPSSPTYAPTGSGAYTASYRMGTRGFFPRCKGSWCEADHLHLVLKLMPAAMPPRPLSPQSVHRKNCTFQLLILTFYINQHHHHQLDVIKNSGHKYTVSKATDYHICLKLAIHDVAWSHSFIGEGATTVTTRC
jgi:hypothetical protein